MKLYFSPGACSLAVHVALEELGAPYAIGLVSTSDGSARSPEHLARNPKGRVPVLDTGEEVITEAVAIMTWLATAHTGTVLAETDPLRLTRAVEWMSWLSSGIHAQPVTQCWRPKRLSDDSDSHAGIEAKGRANLRDACDLVESKLDGGWALAGRYSVVDPSLLVYYRWGNRLGLAMRDLYPNWTRHTRAMLDRPAVQTVLVKEGISVWE